ncbi:hypothetical protein SGPA1_40493 [Streptomyces misionensis JCM 4497]
MAARDARLHAGRHEIPARDGCHPADLAAHAHLAAAADHPPGGPRGGGPGYAEHPPQPRPGDRAGAHRVLRRAPHDGRCLGTGPVRADARRRQPAHHPHLGPRRALRHPRGALGAAGGLQRAARAAPGAAGPGAHGRGGRAAGADAAVARADRPAADRLPVPGGGGRGADRRRPVRGDPDRGGGAGTDRGRARQGAARDRRGRAAAERVPGERPPAPAAGRHGGCDGAERQPVHGRHGPGGGHG